MKKSILFAALLVALPIHGAQAATETDSFTSTITITSSCTLTAGNTLDFGSKGLLTSVTNATTTVAVQCTSGVAYSVRLNEGSSAGGTVATRRMINGATTIDYKMYRDAGRTENWGETDASDWVAGTGDGTSQTHTIYGQVPVQTTPAAGAYNDSVTVTLNY